MLSLKALVTAATPSTKIYIYDSKEDKLVYWGTALTILALLEKDEVDGGVELFSAGPGRLNLHLVPSK